MPEPMPDTLPELVELVWKLAKAKTAECLLPDGGPHILSLGCPKCQGTWRVPDPAYADLLALVEEPQVSHQDCVRKGRCYADINPRLAGMLSCHGTGCIIRTAYIESSPFKALEGALVGTVNGFLKATFPEELSMESYRGALPALKLRDDLLGLLEMTEDTRIPALQVVVRWLEEKP